MAELTHEAARDLGVRIISPDRPGIRDSNFHPNRTLLDWPPLMRELAAHLRIDRFRILAHFRRSALRLRHGVGDAGAGGSDCRRERRAADRRARGPQRLAQVLQLAARTAGIAPGIVADRCFTSLRPFALMKLPIRVRPLLLKLLQPCDANVLRDSRSFEACFESARQAWRSSAAGVMTDAEIYAKPWGFPLEEVRRACSALAREKGSHLFLPARGANRGASPELRIPSRRRGRSLLAADSPHARNSFRSLEVDR